MPLDPSITAPNPRAPILAAARPLTEQAEAAAAAFVQRFGQPPTWIAAAPGRINLIGEHVDYCDGLVLPMAIDRHVVLAAAPAPENAVRVFSELTGEETVIPLGARIKRGAPAWANYLRGVTHGFVERGARIPGMSVLIASDLPMGGGLSSSAALEVAAATLLQAATGLTLAPVEMALLCQKAEHEFAGVPCGIMDQFSAVFGQAGHFLLLDCRSREITPVALRDESVTILIINSNVRHELSTSEYSSRRAQCEEAARRLGLPTLRDATLGRLEDASAEWPEPLADRARHVITEIARTRDAATALADGDWRRAGENLYASHNSLRDDFEVSCPELDLIVNLARSLGHQQGMYGCRLTGGGFGGCCVALVKTGQAPSLARVIAEAYQRETGLAPTLFASRPSAGATLLAGGPMRPGA